MTTPAPLRFYLASAMKRICFDSGFVEANARMYLAKWQNLYVIAKDAANFFIVTEEKAPEFVKTERDEKNELKVATDGPVLLPVGSAFEWTIECGSTCPDGCDETIIGNATRTTKEEALALAAQWDGTQVRGPRDFIRVRGPAFYQIKRPTPRPAPVVVPHPRPAARNAPIPTNRNFNPYYPYFELRSISQSNIGPVADENSIHYIAPMNQNSQQVLSRITDEIVRSVRAFQQATVTPAPASIPDPYDSSSIGRLITGARTR